MFIITNKVDDSIFDMDTKLDYLKNGYPRLINKNIAFVKDSVNIYEVNEIPSEIELSKYCYTVEKGFYENPNYRESYDADTKITKLEQTIARQEQNITELQLALVEVYEKIGGQK